MSAAISQAALKQPFRVLGRELNPYSLWHKIFLESVDSSFAIAKPDQTLEDLHDDLIISAYFCSYDYLGGLEQLDSKLTRCRIKLWRWRCGEFDVFDAVSYFREYISYYSAYPNFWIEDGCRSSGGKISSYAQFLKVKMMQEFGMHEVDALNTPYNVAITNYLTLLESKNAIRFMTEEDSELIARTQRMEDKLKALGEKFADAVKVRNN